jgi:hypothetical protein
MTRSRNRVNSPPLHNVHQHLVIRPGYISPLVRPPGIPHCISINPRVNQPPIPTEMNNVSPMYRMMYRDYYIQQFKSIYCMLMVHHRQHIQLNNMIYAMSEMVRSGRQEYQEILKHEEMYNKIQKNTLNYLIMNIWKIIDEMNKSCFPNIDFKYDYEFRNIYMLFELIHQIISNKIE